jgi:anhydro-N-acetylmuramic acid kinase
VIVVGLMSGTSHDSIDAAAARVTMADATVHLEPLGTVEVAYPPALRADLVAALPPSPTTVEALCRLDTQIGQAFAEVAARAVDELCGGSADLVVSHGQTLFHWVEGGAVAGTLQVGQPAWVAERTGTTVVSDLRARDVAAGGQGAPLVSAFDVLWLHDRPGVAVALNLGGIANVTVVAAGRDPVAFDTGPANALVDAAVVRLTGGAQAFDRDGALAAAGTVDEDLLARLLDEPYYARPAPKTTGKELFHPGYLDQIFAAAAATTAAEHGAGGAAADGAAADGASASSAAQPSPGADLVATLTELTARTVADAVLAHGATSVVASGGGTRNPVLMARLAAHLPGVEVLTSDDLGIPSQAKEALAFAVLGFLTVHGVPASVASCTGARGARVLGSITPGDVWPPAQAAVAPPARLVVGASAQPAAPGTAASPAAAGPAVASPATASPAAVSTSVTVPSALAEDQR